MKGLNEFINEEMKSSFDTIINKDNISLLEKVIDYVNKNGETEFRFTTKPADTLLSIEVFNANNEPGKRYIKL